MGFNGIYHLAMTNSLRTGAMAHKTMIYDYDDLSTKTW